MPALSVDNFAELFGADTLPDACVKLISNRNWQYRIVSDLEREQVLHQTLKAVNSEQLVEAGSHGREHWDQTWEERLESFKKSNWQLDALTPKYVDAHRPFRLNQHYINPVDSAFELNWRQVLQRWLFTTYFKEAKAVYEFGCGPGHNLAALASMYPAKRYIGLDWSPASVATIDNMAQVQGWNMQGQLFDFFAPGESSRMEEDSIVLTVTALEQTGQDHGSFLSYLMDASPKLCVHIEPVVEWYDDSLLFDYVAILYHERRNYLKGFVASLEALAGRGAVEIIKLHRTHFGSRYGDSYSQIIWRPL